MNDAFGWSDRLRQLNTLLAELYPDPDAARRAVVAAGLPPAVMKFHAAASINWFNILDEARRRGQLEPLVAVAKDEFPNRPEWMALASAAGARVSAASAVVKRRQLHAALLSAFPSEAALAQLISFGFEQNLQAIATGNLSQKIFEVIEWAQAHGRLPDLIREATAANPSSEELTALAHPEHIEPRKEAGDGPPELPVSSAPAAQAAEDGTFWARYLDVQSHLVDEHRRRFVGRSNVRTSIDRFVAQAGRGYFLVTAGPGFGKTALASEIINRTNALYHLCRSDGDRADSRLILCSLMRQAASRLGAEVDTRLDIESLAQRWLALLGQLASMPQPVIVVIDALDELADTSPAHFLPDARLPEGVFFIVTCRRGPRLDELQERIAELPSRVHDLQPLTAEDVAEFVARQRPSYTEAQRAWIGEISGGNPLYLRALLDELDLNPRFNADDLPAAVDEYYWRVVRRLPDQVAVAAIAGLLATARGPLSPQSLSDISGLALTKVEDVLRALRPVLAQSGAGVLLYHQTFADFVRSELLNEDQRKNAHAAMARWLGRTNGHRSTDAWQSLAFHLYHASDPTEFYRVINEEFLAAKALRFGFAVLEDVELLTRCLLEAGEPALIERSVTLVEGLRRIAGGDLMNQAERTVHLTQAAAVRGRVVMMRRSTAAVDIYVGMVPKIGVSADFVEVVPTGSKVWIIIGDAPGAGLKSAFAARFVANLFRRFVGLTPEAGVHEILQLLHNALRPYDYFDWISMQCVLLDPEANQFQIVNAGHPYPVLYSANRHTCDRLPIRGPLRDPDAPPDHTSTPRAAEFNIHDVLVLVSDGLTEGGRLKEPYGYRFREIVQQSATQPAKVITERILADWQRHPRPADWTDDATVIVAGRRQPNESHDEN